jgi:hypothetical protein
MKTPCLRFIVNIQPEISSVWHSQRVGKSSAHTTLFLLKQNVDGMVVGIARI